MKALAKTRVVGGSIMVTIPAEIVREKAIRDNEMIEIEVNKIKRDYFGALKGIGHFTREDRLRGQLEE